MAFSKKIMLRNCAQDTADTYSNGTSERVIGKALKEFKIPRSKVVILTKIFNPVMDANSRPVPKNDGMLVNQMGLSRKHVFEAVDRCLERLGTDYIGKSLVFRIADIFALPFNFSYLFELNFLHFPETS